MASFRALLLYDLQLGLADLLAKAKARRADEKQLKADLKLFPVTGGKTLNEWVDQFLTAGEKLDDLLGQRAAKDTGARKDAGKLRLGTIGLLTRLRGALGDELDHDAALPKNLDAQVFAYLDQLAAMRSAGGSSAPAGVPAPPAPPVAPPAGGAP